MSLILDALKKAERERNREAYGAGIPGLSTEPAPIAQASSPPLPSWALVTLLLLLALMVLGFWVWVLRKPADAYSDVALAAQAEPVLAVAQSVTSSTVSSVAVMPSPSPVAVTVAGLQAVSPSSLASVDWTERVDSLYLEPKAPAPRPAPVKMATRENPTAAKEPQTLAPAPAVKTPVNDLPPDDELRSLWQSVREGSEPLADAQAPLAETPAPVTEAGRLVPYLHQLPDSFQSHIPTLMYTNHIYSAEKGGAVILNDKSYREGDTLAPDLVIERITETDLLLRYRGKPFRLAALSSWVTGKP